jgi:cystathionine beta-lyase/cystathionine gamma-synthase
VKTLALRMTRHQESALQFAQRLEKLSCVKWVRYPFLPSHPHAALAKRQMVGGSGLVTVDFALPAAAVREMLRRLKLFSVAVSLGGVESLVCHPATMTHNDVPAAQRKRVGITDTMVRFSIGIEEPADLLADLHQALATIRPKDRSLDALCTR